MKAAEWIYEKATGYLLWNQFDYRFRGITPEHFLFPEEKKETEATTRPFPSILVSLSLRDNQGGAWNWASRCIWIFPLISSLTALSSADEDYSRPLQGRLLLGGTKNKKKIEKTYKTTTFICPGALHSLRTRFESSNISFRELLR